MSNECDISVLITGPESTLTTLKNLAIRQDAEYAYVFDLERLHPNPFKNDTEGIAIDRTVPFKLDQSTEWYHENWGTTKPCFFKEIENSDEKYWVKFLTSYSPPLKAFIKISRDFPELTFEIDFWGVGSGFCGTFAYRDGECVFGEFFENDEYDALFAEQPGGEAPQDMPDGDDAMVADDEDAVQNLFAVIQQ